MATPKNTKARISGFQCFPGLRYFQFGYVHYFMAYVLYPEVMERDFRLQADLAIVDKRRESADTTRQENIAPDSVMGSYAGAIGIPQFMPTSYEAYSVDFNGNGRRDLVNEMEDAGVITDEQADTSHRVQHIDAVGKLCMFDRFRGFLRLRQRCK